MWIFTKYGFFSAVCARKDEGMSRELNTDMIMVRARSKDHLENLVQRIKQDHKDVKLEIVENDHTDYKYRTFISKEIWADILGKLGEEIDYGNFKNKVADFNRSSGSYLHSLHDVWGVMYDFQNRE